MPQLFVWGICEIWNIFKRSKILSFVAEAADTHAVLAAFIIGLILAKTLSDNGQVTHKMRTVALAFLTPIFFIKAGLNVSLPAVYVNLGLVLILFAVKIGTKFLGVYPLSKKYLPDDALYTTLLMSTGLTFGTISAVYGLSAKRINIDQFSILVTVVVASAVIPTIIAKKFEPLHGLLGPILVLLHAGLPFEFKYAELFNAGTAGIFTGLWTREVRNYSGTGATYIFHLWVGCSFQLQYT